MNKRIIALVDFSEYSNQLIEQAYQRSVKANAKVLFVHQLSLGLPMFTEEESRTGYVKAEKIETNKKLIQLINYVIQEKFEYSIVITENNLEDEVNSLLAQKYDQFVIAGIKGTGTLKRIFIGSTIINITENCEVPILAVPEKLKNSGHQKLFVAISFDHAFNVPDLYNFIKFSNDSQLEIVFFSVVPEKNEIVERKLKKITAIFSEKFKTRTKLLIHHDPFEELSQLIQPDKNELLVIQKGSRFFKDRVFRKFFVNELVYSGHIPLLILP